MRVPQHPPCARAVRIVCVSAQATKRTREQAFEEIRTKANAAARAERVAARESRRQASERGHHLTLTRTLGPKP